MHFFVIIIVDYYYYYCYDYHHYHHEFYYCYLGGRAQKAAEIRSDFAAFCVWRHSVSASF